MLADNKLALNAGWDDAMLRVEIDDLQGTGFDLGLIGFSADEIAALTFDKNAGLTDPDEAPDAPAATVSEPGDVWLLGRHRLVCGDCTDPLVLDKALNGVNPHLMVTDPPYGVEYDAAWRGHVRTANGKRLSLGVHAKGKVENDGKADWREAWVLFPGDVAYVWHAAMRVGELKESLEEASFALRAQIIWAKNNFAISRGHTTDRLMSNRAAVPLGRIGAMVLRSSWPRILEMVYWPAVQMLTWGFFATCLVQAQGVVQNTAAIAAGALIGGVLPRKAANAVEHKV